MGSVQLAVNGTLEGDVAVIAFRNVFNEEQAFLQECARKPHTLGGQQFCDELFVLPPGVYEVVVQSPDPDCSPEQDHYKVLVEPEKTVEIAITLVCGHDTGGLDTVVLEDHRPVIEDVNFEFEGGETANKYVCDEYEPVVIEAVLSDADTACTDLQVVWTSSNPTYLVLLSPVAPHLDPATLQCVASITVDPLSSVPGDYEVELRVVDDGPDDPYTTSLTFPVHVIDCGLSCNVNNFCDGEFRTGDYWTPTAGAYLSPLAVGNGNPGTGTVPIYPDESLSQTLTVLPRPQLLRAGFDARVHCVTPPCTTAVSLLPPLLFIGSQMAVVGNDGDYTNWVSVAGCLGEAAFGPSVLYSLAGYPAYASEWAYEFDNAYLEVVDAQTCPAIGTILNEDMQGAFGWTSTAGTVSYGDDAGVPYVRVDGTGCPARNLSSLMSVPLETTMAHPTLRFDYRGDGPGTGASYVVTARSQLFGYLNATTSWQSATYCVDSTLAGLVQPLRFFNMSCGTSIADYFELKNVRLEEDATACP